MPKKKEITEEVTEEVTTKPLRLTQEFGREDLNDMRDAINELYQR